MAGHGFIMIKTLGFLKPEVIGFLQVLSAMSA